MSAEVFSQRRMSLEMWITKRPFTYIPGLVGRPRPGPSNQPRAFDDFVTTMAEPVHRRGGEVLKFIGDAMLAIFPMADDLDRDRACLTALAAARESLVGFDKLNEARCALGRPPLGVKVALHAGTVVFGNIGAPSRLDFTAIGPAVNMVTRLEGLAGRLGLRLLASARFASPCDSEMVSIGYHPLRGIAVQQELFTVPEEAARVRDGEASDG